MFEVFVEVQSLWGKAESILDRRLSIRVNTH